METIAIQPTLPLKENCWVYIVDGAHHAIESNVAFSHIWHAYAQTHRHTQCISSLQWMNIACIFIDYSTEKSRTSNNHIGVTTFTSLPSLPLCQLLLLRFIIFHPFLCICSCIFPLDTLYFYNILEENDYFFIHEFLLEQNPKECSWLN